MQVLLAIEICYARLKWDKNFFKREVTVKQSHKTIILWLGIVVFSIAGLQIFKPKQISPKELKFSQFLEDLNQRHVKSVIIDGDKIVGQFVKEYDGGAHFKTIGPVQSDKTLEAIHSSGASLEYLPLKTGNFWQKYILPWLPIVLLFTLIIYFMRQLQSGGGKAMSFGKSKAKLLTEKSKKVTFKDVAGIDEAREELEEIVDFLKNPKKFTRLGGRLSKGVLMMGSPGTGKTLLARAIAGEAGVPFFSISGSDFVEMFVGVGASRVRDLFEQGKKHAPCIIFIDEIDAVGRHRGAGLGGGHDEREQTLNQLLVEMDGFESNDGVILIAATNRPDVLDPALLRPGRFDRRIMVPKPDIRGREEILAIHMKKVPSAQNVNLEVIAKSTPGFSGADLQNLVNEAALWAARNDKSYVEFEDLEFAKDKVMMGSERRSMFISEKEKANTAYHEAGHALVAKMIPGSDPVHKVTIIPRGMALGLTQQLPEEDKYSHTKQYAENSICILMGGRIAEEIVFNEKSTGAGNDIEKATELARKMVCLWGMSDRLGPVTYGKRDDEIFLGREFTKVQDFSDDTSHMIDEEVKNLVLHNYERAKNILLENIEQLHSLAKALLEYETLDTNQIDIVLAGGTLPELSASKPIPPLKDKKLPKGKKLLGHGISDPHPSQA